MINIAFLDLITLGKVDNIKLLSKLGNLETYDSTEPGQVVERCLDKEIVIVNNLHQKRSKSISAHQLLPLVEIL